MTRHTLSWAVASRKLLVNALQQTISLTLCCCTFYSTSTAKETQTATFPSPVFGSDFSKHWFDGNAEITTYKLVVTRYGSPRAGNAISIFVTEDFSKAKRVKADPDKTKESDKIGVMKLNLVKDFPTGIYDYNTMLSTFVTTVPFNDSARGAGYPVKISFSSQEWCGHVYQQLLPQESWFSSQTHSYFDGEADQFQKIDYPNFGIFADSLFHWARDFAAPLLKPGESKEALLYHSLMETRLDHVEPIFVKAQFSVDLKTEITPAAGTEYLTRKKTVQTEDGRSYSFYVEDRFPNRIVKWIFATQKETIEEAELVGAKRTPYWKLNNPESIGKLREIGLEPRNRMSP